MSDGQVSETQSLTPEPDDVRTNDGVPDAADTGHAAQGRPKDYGRDAERAGTADVGEGDVPA